MTKKTPSILKLKRVQTNMDYPAAIETVRKATGKGQLRQAIELAGLVLGRRRFSISEYYSDRLWRTDLTKAEKAEFVSSRQSSAINRQLSPVDLSGLRGFLANKLLTSLALRSAGFPMLKPLAIYADLLQLPGTERLSNATDIVAFLSREGVLPVFGKPLHSSLGIGAASYVGLANAGKSIVFGNRKIVALEALSHEIADNFGRGYVFEPLIRQHRDVEAVTGPAVGTLRVVTLRTPDGADVLYTLQRLPGVGAMMDAPDQETSYATALIDAETGRIVRARVMDKMATGDLQASAVTGVRYDTAVLPFLKEAHAMAIEVHRLLARPGLLAFDIALTPDGPLINEVNSNPFHTCYQYVADRGLLNSDFKPRIETAIALVKAETA